MLKSRMNILWAVIGSLAVGTLVAETILLTAIWTKWKMTPERFEQAITVARGGKLVSDLEKPAEPVAEKKVATEQPSFDEMLRQRALAKRDFELREEAIRENAAQLVFDQEELDKRMVRYNDAVRAFKNRLSQFEKSRLESGLEENVSILENLPPEEAKTQLVRMFESKQLGAVLSIVSRMDPSRRRRITAAFVDEKDSEILGDILKLIREGQPEMGEVDRIRGQIGRQVIKQPLSVKK
jgi:hypothetical protein